MATQTHQLNIKAKLDTSEVRAELDRLNQSRGAGAGAGGAQSQGAAQRTTQLLTKLDSTLNKLNSTLQNLAAAFKQGGMPGGSGNRSPSQNGYIPLSQPFTTLNPFIQMGETQFNAWVKQLILKVRERVRENSPNRDLEATEEIRTNPGLISFEEFQALRTRRPQLFSNNEQVRTQAIQKIMETPNAGQSNHWWDFLNTEIMSPATAKKWRGRMQAGFLGHQIAAMGAQIGQLAGGEETSWGRFIGGAGNVFNAGAMGFMINPLVGALTAASQAAMEFAKEVVRARMELLQNETKVIAGVAEANRTRWLDLAETNVLGEDTELQEQQAQARLTKARDRRSDLLDEMAKGPSPTFDAETRAEIMGGWQAQLKDLDQEIKLNKEVLDTIQRRKTVLNNEIEANQNLAQAEREFAESIRRNEEAERNRHYLDSEENVQAYRTAQRQHREQMRQRDIQVAGFERQMDFQRSQAQIRLGMWRGGTAEDYFKEARTKRQSLIVLNAARSHETDPQKLRQLNEDITAMQEEFQHTMMIGQLLKNLGNPLQKMQLGSLTSLANRGVNMGERTEMQRPYDKKMDEMIDVLQTIEENTRAAEKVVWE